MVNWWPQRWRCAGKPTADLHEDDQVRLVGRDLEGLGARLELLESCAPCQFACLMGTHKSFNTRECISWFKLVKILTLEFPRILPAIWVMENTVLLLERYQCILKDIVSLLYGGGYAEVIVAEVDEQWYGVKEPTEPGEGASKWKELPSGMKRPRMCLVAFMEPGAAERWRDNPPHPNTQCHVGMAAVFKFAAGLKPKGLQSCNVAPKEKWAKFVDNQLKPSTQARGLLGATKVTAADSEPKFAALWEPMCTRLHMHTPCLCGLVMQRPCSNAPQPMVGT